MTTARKRRRAVAGREEDPRRLRHVEQILPALMDGGQLPQVRLTDSAGSFVTTFVPGGPVLWASRRAIDGHPEALRGELAHEVAHLRDDRRRIDTIVALVGCVPLGIVGVVTMLRPWQVGEHVPIATLVAGWLTGLLLLCTAMAAIRFRNHRAELRADARATQILGDVGPVLAMIDQVANDYEQFSRAQKLVGALTHPTPALRREALLAQTSQS